MHNHRHSGESRRFSGRNVHPEGSEVPFRLRGSGGMVDAHALGACGLGCRLCRISKYDTRRIVHIWESLH